MSKNFLPLAKHPGSMTGAELRRALGDLPDSKVMRSLLVAELSAIRGGAAREQRTMRGLWYDLIKPSLSRAGRLGDKTRAGKPVEWPALLSKYLAEMVREGTATYEDFGIIDGSRQRQTATDVTRTIVESKLVGGHFPWVILFTEKDTIWSVVEDLATLYGVSAISGGGEPSNACTENTVRRIIRSQAYQDTQPEKIILLSLTDYDPSGYVIANAQWQQIFETANTADGIGKLKTITHVRLGLTPNQLTPEEREANAYEPSDKGLDSWLAETGGIDGQPLGLELDALPLSRLRRMFAEGIEQHVDLEKRRDDLRSAFVDLIACGLLSPDFETRRSKMIAAVKANGLWKAINETALPDDLFRQAAIAGLDCIDPLDYGLFDCADQIRAVMAGVEHNE